MKIWFVSSLSGDLLIPETFQNQCYGSEFAFVEVAKRLGATCFSNTPKGYKLSLDGIEWRSDHDYEELVKENPPDVLVISRFLAFFFQHTIPSNCKVYLWLHDLVPHTAGGIPINVMGVVIPQVTKFICVGNEMVNGVSLGDVSLKKYGIEPRHCVVIKNGITLDPTWPSSEKLSLKATVKAIRSHKQKNTFIYSSWAAKGLWNVLDKWHDVLKVMPDAVLNVYYNHSPEDVERRSKYNFPSIHYHGRVTQDVLFEAMKTAEYWLFPNDFPETCCTTAYETAYYGCIQITNNRGELKYNVPGLLIERDATDDPFWGVVLDILKTTQDDDHLKDLLVERQYKFASAQTWDVRADEWRALFSR